MTATRRGRTISSPPALDDAEPADDAPLAAFPKTGAEADAVGRVFVACGRPVVAGWSAADHRVLEDR